MPDPTEARVLEVSALERTKGARFRLVPDAEDRARLAEALGLQAIRKLSFAGEVMPEGDGDWHLSAKLGATVVQECVVTLAPVVTRIDEPVERRFRANPPPEPEGGEVEMPEEENEDPLGETIDLAGIMRETLALALPAYPRAEGAELGDAQFTEPGKAAMTDEDARPFAGLKSLRDRLKPEDEV